MQAKHVQKGSQAGLIKGIQNQAKKRASACEFIMTTISFIVIITVEYLS